MDGTNLDTVIRSRVNSTSHPYKMSIQKFNKSMKELEHDYLNMVRENITLRLKIDELEGRILNTETQKTDGDTPNIHSFTKKMGAFLDGASNKFKITRQKILKDDNLIKAEKKIAAHTDSVLDITCKNSLIATCSFDKMCKMWSLDLESCLYIYRGHSSSVNSCRFSPTDELYACSASGDGTVHVWSVKQTSEQPATHMRPDSTSRPRADSSNEEWTQKVETEAGNDKIVYINKPIFEFKAHQSTVSFAEWSFDGNYVVSSSWDRSIIVWDVEKAKSIANYTGHEEEVLYICCHPYQSLFLSTSADCSIRLWDMRTGTSPSVEICKAHNGDVNSALFTGLNIISGSVDKTAKMWEIRSMREPLVTLKTSSPITRMSINSDGYICIPMRNNHFRIWYLNAKLARSFYSQQTGHTRSIESSCWHDAGAAKYLYTCSIDGSVIKWSAQNPTNELKC